MKVYKQCEPCKSDGLVLCGEELQPCDNCNGVGFLETEIPVEQALEALKIAHGTIKLMGVHGAFIPEIKEAIKALEECIK